MSKSILFVVLYILTLEVKHANGLRLSTTSFRQRANNSLCPSMVSYPSILELDFGKNAVFSVYVEAKLESPLVALWQRILNNSHTKDINRYDIKYYQTEYLPNPRLVINKLDFNDVGYYQLQVKITGGWCTSPKVHLRKVRGILQYNNRCNETRECDERKHLECSQLNTQKKCLCSNHFYHRHEKCFEQTRLVVTFINSNITSSEINVMWRDPSTDSDLILSYSISIRDNGGTTIKTSSVGKQTSYKYNSYYVPGRRYFFKITSTVKLSNPSEIFTVETQQALVVEPLPPGPVIKNASNFHPEKLHLKWISPGNNTRVDEYYISIGGYSFYASSNEKSFSQRWKPGKNYTVSIFARSHGKSSKAYKEELRTLRTPVVIMTTRHSANVLYLSAMEITASVKNMSGFPPTLETKWETNTPRFNITHSRYNGSSLDLFSPKLVINKVDFYHEEGAWFRCAARNSEGWGTSEYRTTIDVHGSLKFSEPCYESRECLEYKYLTCRSDKCLCDTSYYHKGKVCYSRSYLQARAIRVQSSTCDITITWEHPTRDRELITGYQVISSELKTRNQVISTETVYVGNETEYRTPCELRPGKLNSVYVRSDFRLINPTEEVNVNSGTYYTILEPFSPGPLLSSLSNFSADNLYLRWEKSGGNSFVNRYRVTIEDRSQETTGYVPEIYWEELLMPGTLYNVTITAISYGYSTNYPSRGSRESLPSSYKIETSKACQDYTYGEQCPNLCVCAVNNTKQCDPVTGECICKTGWEGQDCSRDLDECGEEVVKCDTNLYQVCINTPGSAHCECRFGGINITVCNHPKPAHNTNQSEVKIKAETTFDIKINHKEFLADSEKWRQEFEASLMKFYKAENVRGLSAVIILTIRQLVQNHNIHENGTIQFGSVIIDYEIIGSKTESKEMKTDLSSSMGKLLTGEKKMTVFDQTPAIKEITIKDPNGTVTKNISVSSKPCDIFHGFGGTCPAGERCDDTVGIATCLHAPSYSSDISHLVLIVEIAGGILVLFVIVIVVLILCLYCNKRSRNKESTPSEGDIHLRGKDHEPKLTRNSGNTNCKSDTMSDYDVINPTNVYTNENEYLELADIPLHFYGNTKNEGPGYANCSSDFPYETPVINHQIPRVQGWRNNSRKVRRYQRY